MNIFNPKELKLSIETLSNTQDIDRRDVVSILEKVISISVRQSYNKDNVIIANILDDYTVELYIEYIVIDDNHKVLESVEYSSHKHLYEDQAEEQFGAKYSAGDSILEKIEDFKFERTNVNIAKQQIKSQIARYKKEILRDKFLYKKDELVKVIVKSYDKRGYSVEYMGEHLGFIPYSSLFNDKEKLRVGSPYSVLFDFDNEELNQRYGLCFKRTGNEFILAILNQEISDIQNEMISVGSIYREKGNKIVIAVRSADRNIDVVGSCIGVRGVRINSVRENFYGESIDVLEYFPEPEKMISSMIKNISILVETDSGYEIVLQEEDYNKVKDYQKDALAQFTGTKIIFLKEEEYNKNNLERVQYFSYNLDIDEESASIIADAGLNSIDEVAIQGTLELSDLCGIDEESAKYISKKANDMIKERNEKISLLDTDLKNMDSLDDFLIIELIENDIKTKKSLSDLDVFELQDILPLNKKRASNIIMESRDLIA
jgi:N utilization substance protein A